MDLDLSYQLLGCPDVVRIKKKLEANLIFIQISSLYRSIEFYFNKVKSKKASSDHSFILSCSNYLYLKMPVMSSVAVRIKVVCMGHSPSGFCP